MSALLQLPAVFTAGHWTFRMTHPRWWRTCFGASPPTDRQWPSSSNLGPHELRALLHIRGLDEVAELDLQVQAKLLRALESKQVTPVGASLPDKVDFALCSAINQDLRALVQAGALRQDLYYRIALPVA